jgi:hypothetical protein
MCQGVIDVWNDYLLFGYVEERTEVIIGQTVIL